LLLTGEGIISTDRLVDQEVEMEQMRLDNQVAVVTGAGRGLGRAYATLLGERGAQVVVNNRIRAGTEHEPPIAEELVEIITSAGGTAVANTADIGTQDGATSVVQTALDAFGRIDIVVNNAGIVHFYKFADYPDEELDNMLAIQLRATWFVTQAAWPHLQAQGYGRVVNTVSRGAFFGDPQGAAYATAKGGTYGLTRALAVEGAEHGIKVNAISPTAWTPLYARAPDVTPERRKMLEENFGPELVAPVIVALAHSSCPFTGEIIGAAGGHISRMFMAQTQGTHVQAGFTPEEFIERLPEVWAQDDAIAMGLVTPGVRGSGTPVTEVPPEARPRQQAG
jgi:NAD(P)-dependent dehydrogenase (short-subunit alcohol dehydrogenase family)